MGEATLGLRCDGNEVPWSPKDQSFYIISMQNVRQRSIALLGREKKRVKISTVVGMRALLWNGL